MRKSHVLLSVSAAAASLATAPAAAADPGMFASARQGSLLVSSSALISNRNAEMMGGWTNDRVKVRRDSQADGQDLHRPRARRPDKQRAAHQDRPGDELRGGRAELRLRHPGGRRRTCVRGRVVAARRYDFATDTRHHSGLHAIGSVFFRITDPC